MAGSGALLLLYRLSGGESSQRRLEDACRRARQRPSLDTPAPQLEFITAQQLGWNAWYFLLGRAVGVVPYFLPLIAIFAACRRGEGRLAIVLAALAIALAFLLIRPFNFWGGGGSLANRYFLPVYGALWFVAARPLNARMAWLTAVCAAPLLWPLWLAPRAFPLAPDGSLGTFRRFPGECCPTRRRRATSSRAGATT